MHHLYLLILLLFGLQSLSAQEKPPSSLDQIFGEEYIDEIENKSPKLYHKLLFDASSGWKVVLSTPKYSKHPEIQHISEKTIDSGMEIVQLFKERKISRYRSKKRMYLLADKTHVLILDSQEEHLRSFNKHMKS